MTLVATEDNYVTRSAGALIQTNGETLTVKTSANSQTNARTAYFKFDTTGVSSATDGNVATLTLTTSGSASTNFTFALYALNTGAAGFNWQETTLTWNNSPAVGPSSSFYIDLTKATSLTTSFVPVTSAAGTKFSFTFSDWSSYVQADSTLTLIAVVTNQQGGSGTATDYTLNLASSENVTIAGSVPVLSIVPEPGTLTLAAISALGLLRRRR